MNNDSYSNGDEILFLNCKFLQYALFLFNYKFKFLIS